MVVLCVGAGCWGCLASLACAAGCFEAASSCHGLCLRARSGGAAQAKKQGRQNWGASAMRPFGPLARSRRLLARVERVGVEQDDRAEAHNGPQGEAQIGRCYASTQRVKPCQHSHLSPNASVSSLHRVLYRAQHKTPRCSRLQQRVGAALAPRLKPRATRGRRRHRPHA